MQQGSPESIIKFILFIQMRGINPNTVWISFTKRYIYINLFKDNLLASSEEVFQLYLKVKIIFNFRNGLPTAIKHLAFWPCFAPFSLSNTRSMVDPRIRHKLLGIRECSCPSSLRNVRLLLRCQAADDHPKGDGWLHSIHWHLSSLSQAISTFPPTDTPFSFLSIPKVNLSLEVVWRQTSTGVVRSTSCTPSMHFCWTVNSGRRDKKSSPLLSNLSLPGLGGSKKPLKGWFW